MGEGSEEALTPLVKPRGQSVVLVGFMGTGKSAAGRALAQQTGRPRFDTDEMISQRFGLPIREIFAQFGEKTFRDAETEALSRLSVSVAAIIVTGGGIVLRAENVQKLQALGVVVNLEANEETLWRRVSRRTTRPLMQTENPRGTLRELLLARQSLYRAAADVHIDTSNLTRAEVVAALLRQC
ncbi:MAG: shikimate kinase [Verrucomicrobiota bacterium]